MFRKTFIRLILATTIATTTLIVFASTRNPQAQRDESCALKESSPAGYKSSFMILEALGRMVVSAGTTQQD
ncbi:MAG: hypothetical protein H7Y31_17710 [Chitinophagaceae bacterium]|nr:hypothetical protein [Chitinophagaceae bacterium]